MLEIRKLNLAYGDLRVLWDIDLCVEQGEIVTVVGANGAGKSSLLKGLSRTMPTEAEKLCFNGVSLTGLASHDVVSLGIVQVPEGRHVFSEMTVMENLRMGSYIPAARKERDRNLERVFSLFPHLKERNKQLAGTLSGGEQQMLAIARGLMTSPKLMLLDEPSLGLSPLLTTHVFGIIREIHRQGTGVLLVEQNVYQSLRISDRAYVLETGRVVLSGPGQEMLEHPRVKASFLGMDVPTIASGVHSTAKEPVAANCSDPPSFADSGTGSGTT